MKVVDEAQIAFGKRLWPVATNPMPFQIAMI